MAAYRRVDDLYSPAGWLPVHPVQHRAQRSATCQLSIHLFYLVGVMNSIPFRSLLTIFIFVDKSRLAATFIVERIYFFHA